MILQFDTHLTRFRFCKLFSAPVLHNGVRAGSGDGGVGSAPACADADPIVS